MLFKRGVNISHWLSQSARRGKARRAWFTQRDAEYIAELGYDHLRIPIDEEQMWDTSGNADEEAFELLNHGLDWAEAAGLRAIVDLHILRSHYFLDEAPALYTSLVEQEKFAQLWRDLSARLGGRAVDQVAYELLNEAVAQDHEDWNQVAMKVYNVVRELEPERLIVLGSNRFGSVQTFDALAVPDDPNTILTFHFYEPMFITHYRTTWTGAIGQYTGPVKYPGQPIAEEDLDKVPPSLHERLDHLNRHWDVDVMREALTKPLAVRERTGLPLYCGEFGVYHHTPTPARLAWYADLISVFKEFNIGWANWDYRGPFGIVDNQGEDTGIASVLLA